MELFVLIEERFGVNDYAGLFFTKEEADKAKDKSKIAYVKREFINPDEVKDEIIFVGSRYNSEYDLHDYIGVFYSYDEASKRCGERCLILSKNLPRQFVVVSDKYWSDELLPCFKEKNLDGVAFYLFEKICEYFQFNEKERNEKRTDFFDEIKIRQGNDYTKLLELPEVEAREEFQARLNNFIFFIRAARYSKRS
ncbi:MAG: hypothetical protein ACT4ON_11105 [Bacteroidota bacterium]